jgi:threonine dehydrogenase-like Zn-dependent dehydrogenase
MQGEWRHGTYAEYAKVPLENCFALDEKRLCGELGYTISDLCAISSLLVPFGGLSEIGLAAGDTIVVAPATGKFGGGAVTTALAMGARVVACGRNKEVLGNMKELFGGTGRIEIVVLTRDETEDTRAMVEANGGREVDAYIDFSPHAAAGSTHISAAMAALKVGGKASFMGGINGKVGINYIQLMMKSLKIQGKFMYERDMVVKLVQMIEKGNLKLGEKGSGWKTVGKFGLDGIEEGIQLAEKESGWGKQVLLAP